jgi:hypothetical protein
VKVTVSGRNDIEDAVRRRFRGEGNAVGRYGGRIAPALNLVMGSVTTRSIIKSALMS